MSEQNPDQQPKKRITRRQFLIVAGAGGVGLLVGARLVGLPYLRLQAAEFLEGSGGPPNALDPIPTAWFEIYPDNRVRLWLPKVEMGQGVHTALAQIAADELEVAWDQLEVVHADTGQDLDDPIGTSASNSVSSLYPILRQAGATVREMLRAEAARQLDHPLDSLVARDSIVFDANDPNIQLTYGEIVQGAGEWAVPEEPAPLKSNSELRYIGQPIPRVDLEAKILGRATFGVDVRLPDMLYGAVAHAPTVEGKLLSAAPGDAPNMPGVVDVVIEDDFVGVVAKSRQEAYNSLAAMAIEWDPGYPWQQAEIDAAVTVGNGPGITIQDEGNAPARLRAGTAIESEYRVAMAYHAHLEPQVGVAAVGADSVQVWTSTQAAVRVRDHVAEALGREPESVVVHQAYLGAGLGHKIETRAAVEAARLSQAVGRPVHVVWSRPEEFRNTFVRPPTHHVLRATLAEDGRIESMQHQQASGKVALPFLPSFAGAVLGHDFGAWRGARIPYAVPNRQTVTWAVDLPFETGWWRGLGLLPNTFPLEGFLDELAHAAGVDPLAFRLRHLADDPVSQRLGNALQAVAEKAGWDSPLTAGRARGIAGCADYGTVVAQVAEVSIEEDQIRVHKVTAAIDPGLIINPDGVRAQVEGCIIMGLSSALFEETTVVDGVLNPPNFGPYRLATMRTAPEIEVVLLQNGTEPSGVGEPPIGPVAPAVANALFSLTGTRLRQLPLRLTS
jgi:isoquinoline 1-oxidoreductase beta subunit